MPKTHVVFGESSAGSMPLLALPDPVVALTDDLSSGPLGDMGSAATGADRAQWWTHVVTPPPDPRYLERLGQSWQQFRTWLRSRTADDAVVIWVAENPAEVTGYLGVLAHLRATAPVSVINSSHAYAGVWQQVDSRTISQILPLLDSNGTVLVR